MSRARSHDGFDADREETVRPIRYTLTVIALLLAVAIGVGCAGGDGDDATELADTTVSQTPSGGGAPRIQDAPGGLTTVEIADKLAPSIVRVQTEGATLDALGRTAPGGGVGTGVIINAEGHIVTNNHVIVVGTEAADRITVTLADQRTLPATIVGRDPATDLAVLDIEADDLTPATFADASELQIGQDVVAIGFALGLRGAPSVTRGVISALNRTIQEQPYTIPDAIQTDAGINPGNSGGPLVDANGEIVGINTAIIRGAQNIGFAISASVVQPTVESLISDGQIERAYVGISTVDVTQSIARSFDLPVERGIAVTLVADGSPADQGGLEENDIIVSIDGQDVANNGELLAILAQREPGDVVSIEYYRGDDLASTDITLASRPEG